MPGTPIRILGISGSLREASHNARLLRLAAAHAPEGVQIQIFDELDLVEPFDEDVEIEGEPAGVAKWRRAVEVHDGVFIATPEYNGSIPGQLKNALDWASRGPSQGPDRSKLDTSAMYGKPVAVISSSTGGFGGIWAQDELKKSLGVQGARVVSAPKVAIATVQDAFDEDGSLRDRGAQSRLVELVAALAAQVEAVRGSHVTSALAT